MSMAELGEMLFRVQLKPKLRLWPLLDVLPFMLIKWKLPVTTYKYCYMYLPKSLSFHCVHASDSCGHRLHVFIFCVFYDLEQTS